MHDGAYDVVVGSLGGAAPVFLLSAESTPVFSADGAALLFMRKGSLVAQPFDVTRRALTGEPIPVADTPGYVGRTIAAEPAVSVSASGSLAYVGPIVASARVMVFDQAGRSIRTLDVPSGNYRRIAVTRDGRRVALVREISPVAADLWVVDDVDKPGLSRLTDASKYVNAVAWAPDGERVAYSATRNGPRDVYVRSLTEATEHLLYRSTTWATDPYSWSSDGRYLLTTDLDPVTNRDILVLSVADPHEPPRPYLRTPANEVYAQISPDGRWVAYVSDKTGQPELYVDAFPTPRREVRVTSDAALTAWWRSDSRQLLIASADRTQLLVADVQVAPTLSISTPRVMGRLPKGIVAGMGLSATGDLQRVVAIVEDTAGAPVTIVEHWTALIDKR